MKNNKYYFSLQMLAIVMLIVFSYFLYNSNKEKEVSYWDYIPDANLEWKPFSDEDMKNTIARQALYHGFTEEQSMQYAIRNVDRIQEEIMQSLIPNAP